MRHLILIIILICAEVFLVAWGAPWQAQAFWHGSAGGGPPPTCSNSLDFTKSCNSQYAGVIL